MASDDEDYSSGSDEPAPQEQNDNTAIAAVLWASVSNPQLIQKSSFSPGHVEYLVTFGFSDKAATQRSIADIFVAARKHFYRVQKQQNMKVRLEALFRL